MRDVVEGFLALLVQRTDFIQEIQGEPARFPGREAGSWLRPAHAQPCLTESVRPEGERPIERVLMELMAGRSSDE